MPRLIPLLTVFLLAACATPTETPASADPSSPAPTGTPPTRPWPAAPSVPDGALDPEVRSGVDRLIGAVVDGTLERDGLATLAASGDARLGWVIADILRFTPGAAIAEEYAAAFAELTGVDPADPRFGAIPWLQITNLMLAWDLPEPPGYVTWKRGLFTALEPKWDPFFADPEATIEWRYVTWGGVLIDDRPVGDATLCERGCIPALDDPALTDVAGGDWYGDDRPVFGVAVGGEAVAFPKHMMEVHEMVNLTLGGRRIGLPYCTLCGSAQAYLTDEVPAGVTTPILRTTGLLSRSNKVMYDLVTGSVFNTFTGRALSGPLREAGVVLEQVPVVTTTWGEWKAAHPDTRIVAQDGGIGRSYPDDPLGGRDDDGPIFPIGQADPRLPAQAPVLGAFGPDGAPVAFPVEQALAALDRGETVVLDGVEVIPDGGGLRARSEDGTDLATHQAFWFAWSQFHPDTALWAPAPGS